MVSLALSQGATAFSQPGRKPKKSSELTDTARKPASATLVVTGGCLNGVSEVILNLDTADTLVTPQSVYIYLTPTGTDVASLTLDSTHLYGVVDYADIQRNNNRLLIGAPGTLFVKTAVKGRVFGKISNVINVARCSSIDFPSLFDRNLGKIYSPQNMMNVRVLEFDIFDRVGNPVYSSRNNEINWDGTYPDKRPATSGVYYYNCIYLDLTTANQQKKTSAGMIELKN